MSDEQWLPTMQLRFMCSTDLVETGSDTYTKTGRILQQMWIGPDGDEDWRDVEEYWP